MNNIALNIRISSNKIKEHIDAESKTILVPISHNVSVVNESHEQKNYNVINIYGKSIPITPRENQCLQLLKKGMSAKQTAYALNLSTRTVENYLQNLRRKTKCHSKLTLLCNMQLANIETY